MIKTWNVACSPFFLAFSLIACPDRDMQRSGWGKPKVVQIQTPLLCCAAFAAVQRRPAKALLQLLYPAGWWVPKSPYFSQGFALRTFTVLLHEGWHWVRTAEYVLHCWKQGQSLWPPTPQKGCTSSQRYGGCHSCPPFPHLSSHPSYLHPCVITRRLNPPAAALPPGCSFSQLLHQPLPGGLSLPRAGLTCLTRPTAGSCCSFLKRLPLNNVCGHVVSENHSHRARWMQTPASRHAPAVAPIHAASFLKNRPLVPQLNYWKSKHRLEVWDYWEN